MSQQIQALYNEATEIYGRMKALTDAFEGKEWPAEKSAEFDRLSDEFDAKIQAAERLKKAREREALIADLNAPVNRLGGGRLSPDAGGKDQQPVDDARTKAFRLAMRGEKGNQTIRFSVKDLSVSNDAAGGFLVGPQEMVRDMIKFVDDQVFIRMLATRYSVVNGESLGAVALDADIEDADWTTEVGVGGTSTVNPFGKRELKPSPLAKLVKMSKKLIRQSVQDVERLILQRLAYKFAVTEEKAFLTGTGANQPLGVFTASSMGISTARDVTAASATALAGDDFIEAKHTLKAAYWNRPGTCWVLSRNVLKAARKLKDTTNNYLWAPGLGPGGGLTGGVPATLVDLPYKISEFAPGTIATGQYVAVVGDFSFYWIADALEFEVQVLVERYAEANQNGYIARQEVDGMPVLEEAFVRLKMA